MNRTDPTFREQTNFAQQDLDFLDELFDDLFDQGDISSDTDKVPDLGLLDSLTQQQQ
jgi:hypothetical protein